jgi:hypothetical protein
MRLVGLLSAVFLAGCGATRTAPPPQTPETARQQDAVASANAALLSSLARREVDSFLSLLSDDAILVIDSRSRLVRGHEALRFYIQNSQEDLPWRNLRLDSEPSVEVCDRRAMVQGTLAADAPAESQSIRFVTLWKLLRDGRWEAETVMLDGPAASRRQLGVRCAPAFDLSQRWLIAAYPAPVTRGPRGAPPALRKMLTDNGWHQRNAERGGRESVMTPEDDLAFAIGVRARLRPPFGAEAIFNRVAGFEAYADRPVNQNRTLIRATVRSDFVAAMPVLEYSHIRVGAGPALALSRWSWWSYGNDTEAWATRTPGAIAAGGVTFPLLRWFFVDFQGQYWKFGEEIMPAHDNVPATPIDQSGMNIVAGFGIRF